MKQRKKRSKSEPLSKAICRYINLVSTRCKKQHKLLLENISAAARWGLYTLEDEIIPWDPNTPTQLDDYAQEEWCVIAGFWNC